MCKFALIIFLLTTANSKVYADSSRCYLIQNQNQKNYCLALTKEQISYCYQINYADTKNFCIAQMKNQNSYCYLIKSNNLKNECLGLVGQ